MVAATVAGSAAARRCATSRAKADGDDEENDDGLSLATTPRPQNSRSRPL
jgi:hypothetical protein